MDDQPPAKRKGPPRSQTYAEQGAHFADCEQPFQAMVSARFI